MATLEQTKLQMQWSKLMQLLCEELGLKPSQILEMSVESDDAEYCTVKWDGVAVLEMARFNELLAQAQE